MKTIVIILASLMVAACSSYKVYRETSSTEEGLRFRASAPYLLVTQKDDGVQQFQVVYLPDTPQYVIKKKGFLGTAELSATLENGWNLTNLNSKSDSQTPETLTALVNLIPALKAAPTDSAAQKSALPISCPRPCLYRYDPRTNRLIQVN